MRKILATIALSSLLATGTFTHAVTPAQATSATSNEQVSPEHQITNASVEIHNDPRLLALGFTNDIAYAGGTVTAHATAEGAEKIEYFWVGVDYVTPQDDWTDNGPTWTFDGIKIHHYTNHVMWVRATWPDGGVRISETPFIADWARGTSATFTAPASIRPGESISANIAKLSAMTEAAGNIGETRYNWYVQYPSKDGRISTLPVATGMKPLVVQPSWKGRELILEVRASTPQGWVPERSKVHIPIQDVAPAPVKVFLPPLAAGPNTFFDAKVTHVAPDTEVQMQWIHNGKIVQDFTSDFGFQFNPNGTVAGDTLQANARSIYPDGTVTAPAASNKIVLATPTFKAPATIITGNATVGQKLTAERGYGVVPQTVKTSRQWLRDGKPITGATGTTYKLTAADADKKISVRTSYKPFDRVAVASTSKPTGPVERMVMRAGALSATGTAKPGKTLKAKALSWKAGATFKYQWLREGKAIKSATKTSYKLTKADAGKRVSIRATVSYPGYKTIVKGSTSRKIAKR
ncbi:hypothetical protein [Paeniglutamicibacter kerguelensis]|uniref:Bacterial Ig domain-containing protein n=1 Tax=Paeniglutamicibacter kerguelensis TaxID=254788 RepID=A0ABS4X7S9_9MICC|nr:hypothetical protein [Paeniglutamicibacter kerguelensis]MBP2384512.1 hypothetical protein [Paeniglutamicibacter kerguelensis]